MAGEKLGLLALEVRQRAEEALNLAETFRDREAQRINARSSRELRKVGGGARTPRSRGVVDVQLQCGQARTRQMSSEGRASEPPGARSCGSAAHYLAKRAVIHMLARFLLCDCRAGVMRGAKWLV